MLEFASLSVCFLLAEKQSAAAKGVAETARTCAVAIIRDRIRTDVYIDAFRNNGRYKPPLSDRMIRLSECAGSDQNLPIDLFANLCF